MNNLKKDSEIIEKLKLKTLSRIICDTDKGMLKLQLRKGETTYWLVLDAVPLEKDLNKELMDLLFPKVNEISMRDASHPILTIKPEIIENIKNEMRVENIFAKPKGRPKGSKNGIKKGVE